ncbi:MULTISPECIES: MalY/PatB family protein [Streptococcus]|uniref:MalY/PatB family protein n=1 Tax=Streptococcus TaxID=1301 RepID=UPI000CF6EB55|nr:MULTISPECIES: MalY/PatB family protein [Streptococcus]MBY5024713.1 pyridoxal phosphate-dependent aminotransferase [Streptococcus suis]QZT17736.1 pyridoxal phosphate-dependent aminotransferase [Streptococcus suis]
MGKYNFDEEISRYGSSCIKYDYGMQRMGRTDLLPMWVADMDFKLPEEILDIFRKRIDHGIFGYSDPDEEYWQAMNHWFGTRHGFTIDPETVTLGAGIVYGLATAVKAYSEPGEAVLIQQPVYYPFRDVIEKNGRKFVNSQLIYDDGHYSIDFEDFEQKIIDNNVKVFILCNPHNPVGRVWTKEELTQLADICLKHNVVILCDEIHCDFVYPGHKTTNFMTLDKKYHDSLVLFLSPSKTFNVAGFQPANIVIPNPELRSKYRASNDSAAYSNASLMGMLAVKACYTLGGDWVDEMVDYLYGNMVYMRDFVKDNFPKATFVEPEGTYLIWVDFSGYGFSDEELQHIMVEEAKLWLDSGKIFGPATAQFERFNIACPRSTVVKAMEQLKEAMDKHEKWEQ